MKVLVTGAAGFIGGELVKRLRAKGHHEVVAWDNFSNASNDPGGVRVRDISYPIRHEADLDGIEVVYNLACANQAYSFGEPLADLNVNAVGVLQLIEALPGAHFVQASSASVYGHGPFLVGSSTKPVTPYGVAKLAAEGYVRLLAPSNAILRLSNVYGPGQSPKNPACGVIAKFIDAASSRKPLEVIEGQSRDFTYISDVLDALEAAMYWRGIANISTGRATPVFVVAQLVREAMGVDVPIAFIRGRDIDSVKYRAVPKTDGSPSGWRPKVDIYDGIRKTVKAGLV